MQYSRHDGKGWHVYIDVSIAWNFEEVTFSYGLSLHWCVCSLTSDYIVLCCVVLCCVVLCCVVFHVRYELGLCHEGLYSKAKSGSKHLAEAYTQTVWIKFGICFVQTCYVKFMYCLIAFADCRCIEVYLRASSHWWHSNRCEISFFQWNKVCLLVIIDDVFLLRHTLYVCVNSIRFFHRHAFGRSALMMSGGAFLGFYHVGEWQYRLHFVLLSRYQYCRLLTCMFFIVFRDGAGVAWAGVATTCDEWFLCGISDGCQCVVSSYCCRLDCSRTCLMS